MRKTISVRIDDVSPYMNRENFRKCIGQLAELGIKPLLGIIPKVQDESIHNDDVDDFWGWMRALQQDGYPIAMHGVHHVYTSRRKGLVCKRPMSEFTGYSLEEQQELLQCGYDTLKENGIETKTFFAPGHSYDMNTLRALKNVGFTTISDGKSFRPYVREGILCVPATSMYKRHKGRHLTICIHPDTEKNIEQIYDFLRANREQVISFEESCSLRKVSDFRGRIQEKFVMGYERLVSLVARMMR